VAVVEDTMSAAVAEGTIFITLQEVEISIIAVEDGVTIATGVVEGVITTAAAAEEGVTVTGVVEEGVMITGEADVGVFGISNLRKIGVNRPRNRPF